MHFFTPRFHQAGPPPAPPTTGTTTGTNSPPTGSADGAATAQQQEQQQQTTTQNQPQPQPNPQQPQQHSGPVPMFPGPGPLAGGLMAALHLAALFDPTGLGIFGQPNGDAVYSQEQLDRIITYLREAQGQGGGAPPASQTAIDKLQTKEVDEEMLGTAAGDKPKCVICVDEMAKGEKVAVLPCTHIFHGECVTPWLKQHNTCPVCRRSIEELEQGKGVKQHQDEHQAEQQHEAAAPNNTTGCV
ncbi:hypothetical protein B0H66DRAFT_563855 [Apodospora peruviana]|uniref:RING-type E3 ubiquitin transferase n=1 Tax=Apodospora peruviana TaxID=516989 RepID=A0AAE0HY05_9PEZI|nr:hypothetical protein B0H66DRAFT_563855 [Apodospora peruviana]